MYRDASPSPALHAIRAIDRAVIELAQERARLACAIDPVELDPTASAERVSELTRRAGGHLGEVQVARLLLALREASIAQREGGLA